MFGEMDAVAELKFSIGSWDRDALMDDMFRLSSSKPRVPNKSRKRGLLSKSAARLVLQKSVACRSSALRQGKFAVARSGNGDGQNFPAAKAAEVKARAQAVTLVGKKQKLHDSKPSASKLKMMLLKKLHAK
ncbi:uncharacterized protein LOC9656533 [Selaginella moellendorffii]|uniref:uncharacterized protein LOC9656533 n=1 Tax=Selaginella moellendorffii TaxID=88036 RepID=UPI000D1C9AA5|nr:uncharacterized protein LOC9656533 [Selaginella moellendorffii]|eukprot:XP_024542325.1 uncharacterized protein LOC9656533 [Selaginella moellendorffii]